MKSMEYFRDPKNQIRADFALHAGKLLDRYDKISRSFSAEEQYEATLCICVLQSLLTNCCELFQEMKNANREIWKKPIHDVPSRFGLKRSFVETDTFSEHTTYDEFITHLRNALSHPTYSKKPQDHFSTGYISLQNQTGLIAKFIFIDSPWVSRGKIRNNVSNKNKDTVDTRLKEFKRDNPGCGELEVKSLDGKYKIFKGTEPFTPIFKAIISIDDLKKLAKELANYLAQPTEEGWDGKSINRLVG